MNLAIRGIDGDLGKEHADTFRRDLHKDLKADYVIANPPFNDSDWHRSEDDVRWKYGTPPKGNANFAWVQHFIHHLSPTGTAGFVLANGSMSINQDKSGAVVSTAKGKPNRGDHGSTLRDRRGKTLFTNTRKMGTMIDRVRRELSEEDINLITATYHNWQVDEDYSDIPGFCKSAPLSEIAEHGHVLTPGRYVGAEEVEDDGEPIDGKLKRLTDELAEQFRDSTKLETAIKDNMKALGFTLKD